MNKKLKKHIAVFITTIFLLTQNFAVASVLAAPDLPDLPDNIETVDETDDSPVVIENQTPNTPETPDQPDNAPTPEPTAQPQTNDSNNLDQEQEDEEIEYTTAEDLVVPDAPSAPEVNTSDSNSGDKNQDNQVGDTTIDTGDANGSGSIMNTSNTNVSTDNQDASPSADGSDVTIVNSGNGDGSDNDASVAIGNNDITLQDNNADIDNNLSVDVNTGGNSASRNTGGDNEIKTGDATAVGTIVNSVNTNITGAAVSEFNVTDDQVGDLILDYEANCVSGCGSVDIENSNNGSNSNNNADLTTINNESTFQNNDAVVENDLILAANTGENQTKSNTGGDNSIDTGDAIVNGNVINMLNNNIAGNVIYGVVNIFDDFIGNIIIPEKYASAYTASDINIENENNGSDSTNNGEVLIVDNESFAQFNDSDIVNNLIIDANTGGNEVSRNTKGDNSIDTGDVNVDASILNIANNNVIGGDWWIVLVNEAGNWIGKIFTPEGALNGGTFAVAGGQSSVNDVTGAITLSNNGNGDNSTNNASVVQVDNSETTQTNNAKIVNNIDLSANTGDNSASRNTGGDNEVKTGDANVQFNLINFINNNFAGGNVYLTIVNVFGSWTGDFVTPNSDYENSDDDNDTGIGGSTDIGDSSSNSSDNSNSDNNNSSSSSSDSSSDSNSNSSSQSVLATQSYSQYGWGTGGAVLGSVESDDDSEFELVDTANASDGSDTNSKKKINLAWALLLIPAYLVVRIARRRFLN